METLGVESQVFRASPLRAPTGSAGGQSSEMPAVTKVAVGFPAF